MNPAVELAAAWRTLHAIGELHAQHTDDPRLCAAGCATWPCATRRMVDGEWPSDTDAPSGVVIRSQTAETASGVPTGGSGRPEANQAPPVARHLNHVIPLAEGTCNHGRLALFNLTAGIIRHAAVADPNSDELGFTPCDGWILTQTEVDLLRATEPTLTTVLRLDHNRGDHHGRPNPACPNC